MNIRARLSDTTVGTDESGETGEFVIVIPRKLRIAALVSFGGAMIWVTAAFMRVDSRIGGKVDRAEFAELVEVQKANSRLLCAMASPDARAYAALYSSVNPCPDPYRNRP